MAEKKILKSDVSEEDIFLYITESAKKSEAALESYNKKLNDTAKVIKMVADSADPSKLSGINALIEAEKKLSNIKNQAVKNDNEAKRLKESVQAYEQLLKEVQKKEEAEIKRAKTEEKLHAQREKQYNKEIQAEEKKSSIYAKVDAKLSGMVKTYRELAIRKELGVKLSEKEERTMNFLADKITKYDTAIKAVDASSGRFQRNVGNYKSGFDGLTFSVTQLAREAPAFGNSIQTGFMAISNNLPMFFDEIAKLKQANIELAKSGEPTKSVFKSLASSLMSTQVLLSVGVTLLTLYGSKLVEWGASLFNTSKEIDKAAQYQRQLNKEKREGAEFVAKESAEFIGNINALRNSNKNSAERAKMIDLINDKYGTTLKNLQDEAQFQKQLNKEVGNYLQLQIEKFKSKRNEDRIERNLLTQEKLNNNIRRVKEEQLNLEKQIEVTRKQANNASTFTSENKIYSDSDKLLKKVGELEAQFESNKESLKTWEKELENAQKRLLTYDVAIEEDTKSTKKNTQSKKELRTEIEYTNDYISDQLMLLGEMNEILNIRILEERQRGIDDYFANLMKQVNETGQFEVDQLEALIHEKMRLEMSFIDAKTAYEIQQLEFVYNEEFKQRRANIDEKYRELLDQENLTTDAKLKINANYNEALKQLDNEELLRFQDLELKKKLLQEKAVEEKKQIEKDAQQFTFQVNDELIEAQIEFYKKQDDLRAKELEAEKKLAEERKKLAKDVRDTIELYGEDVIQSEIERSKKRQSIMQNELQMMQQRQDQLREMANAGNISAQQSLAVSEQLSIKKQQQIDREAKKQQAWETAKIAYKAVFDFMEKGDSLPIATLKGTTGAMSLQALFKSLFGFRKGTKRTVGEELNTKFSSGEDGFLARVDAREKILNPELSALTGNATTDEIVKGFLMAQSGLIVKAPIVSVNNSDNQLIEKIDELKTVIKNKTEFHFSEEVKQGIARGLIVTERSGINRTRTFYRR